MSGRLADEILDHAPADLSPAEMLVLVALALDARESDRQARFHCSTDDLVRRTRLKAGTVRNAISSLCARGLIRRVHERVHKGGKHQEYILAKLGQRHRFATIHDQDRGAGA